MHTAIRKEVLTTGEVAKICHVAPRTVSKWFDTGKLRGYRIPGSRDRRIPVEQLITFMRVHNIPLEGLDGGVCRVLIVDGDASRELAAALDQMARYKVVTAENGFDAGVVAQRFRPHVIVLDASDDHDAAAAICRNIKAHAELQGTKVVAAVSEPSNALADKLTAKGFDQFLAKPYSLDELVQAVEDATDLFN